MKYFAPTSLSQAERLKNKSGKTAYLAGGTILNWRGSPKAQILIDLKNLQLNTITKKGNGVYLGAMLTIQDLLENKLTPPTLKEASKQFTSHNIRNMATLGGTASGNFFVSNLLPVLLAYKSELEYFYRGKKAKQPLEKWLKEKKGIICGLVIKNISRKVKVRQEKIAAIDFPAIVTSIGYEIKSSKITSVCVAVSGAGARTQTFYPAKSEFDFQSLNELVQKNIKPTANVKVSARVKRKFIESHIKEMIKEIEKDLK